MRRGKSDVLKLPEIFAREAKFEGKYVSFENIKFPRGNYQGAEERNLFLEQKAKIFSSFLLILMHVLHHAK